MVILTSFFALVLSFLALVLIFRCSNSKRFYVLIKLKISGDEEFRLFSYNELKDATTSFKSSNKIGQGGFGSVYKVGDSIFVLYPCLLFSKLSCLCVFFINFVVSI